MCKGCSRGLLGQSLLDPGREEINYNCFWSVRLSAKRRPERGPERKSTLPDGPAPYNGSMVFLMQMRANKSIREM